MESVMQMGRSQNVAAPRATSPSLKSNEPVNESFFSVLNTTSEPVRPQGAEDTDKTDSKIHSKQAADVNTALMMIMQALLGQMQPAPDDAGGATVQAPASEGTAAAPIFLQGDAEILDAVRELMAQGGMQPDSMSELEGLVKALQEMQPQAPDSAAQASGDTLLVQGEVQTQTDGVPVQADSGSPKSVLDAVLERFGLDTEQILSIKGRILEAQDAVSNKGVPEAGTKPAEASLTINTDGAKEASDQAAGRQETGSGGTKPVLREADGKAPPAVFQTGTVRDAAPVQVRESAGTAPDIVTQIVEKAAVGIQEGQYRMNIQLKPEHLGKVSIRLAMDADGLVVKIQAQHSGVESTISGQLAQLEQALKDKGITVVRMEVAQENLLNGEGQSQNPQDGKRQRREGYFGGGDGDPLTDAAEHAMFMTLQPYLTNNSVEFQA